MDGGLILEKQRGLCEKRPRLTAYIGAERGLGVRAQGTRRSGDPGRIRPRVLLGRGRETLPTGGTLLAARQGGGRGRWAGTGRERGNGPAGNGLARSFLGRRERKRKGEWVGLKERGKRKPFHFFF